MKKNKHLLHPPSSLLPPATRRSFSQQVCTEKQVLYQISILKILFPSCLSFLLLLLVFSFNGILWYTKVLNFDEFLLIDLFFLRTMILMLYLRNLCLTQGHENFLLCFHLQVSHFYILHQALHPLQVNLSFCRWEACKYMHTEVQVFQHYLLKKYFLQWISLAPAEELLILFTAVNKSTKECWGLQFSSH